MADVVENFNVGTIGDLVTGNVSVDFTNPSATGNLSLLAGTVEVPIAIGSTTQDNGITTITGTALDPATNLVTNVALQLAGPTATTTGVSTSVAGVPAANANENLVVVCFASGTLIRTNRGDVAVEDLAVGDIAITASGTARPIRWIGHRTLDCKAADPRAVRPVRIAADAFGSGRPERDLFVSPGHSICVSVVDEVLVPAGALVNGSTIDQVETDRITYWHVELDEHDILLANGLPAESYLPMSNRDFFVEGGTVRLDATPDPAGVTHDAFCRPFVAGGPLLAAIRAHCAARAEALGWTRDQSTLSSLRVVVDGQVIDPVTDGARAAFLLPAAPREVWLESAVGVPAHSGTSDDGRELGVMLEGLMVDDGLESRRIGADDERLCVGFHGVEAGGRRWTDGRALLPPSLWDGCRGAFFLRLEIAGVQFVWSRPEVRSEGATATKTVAA